jgi:hypothetical protein
MFLLHLMNKQNVNFIYYFQCTTQEIFLSSQTFAITNSSEIYMFLPQIILLSQNLTGVCCKAQAKSLFPTMPRQVRNPPSIQFNKHWQQFPWLFIPPSTVVNNEVSPQLPTHLPEMMSKHRENFIPYCNTLFCNSNSKGKNTHTKILCFTLLWSSFFKCTGADPLTPLHAASVLSMFQ